MKEETDQGIEHLTTLGKVDSPSYSTFFLNPKAVPISPHGGCWMCQLFWVRAQKGINILFTLFSIFLSDAGPSLSMSINSLTHTFGALALSLAPPPCHVATFHHTADLHASLSLPISHSLLLWDLQHACPEPFLFKAYKLSKKFHLSPFFLFWSFFFFSVCS